VTITVAAAPDPVAILQSLLLMRAADAGDDTPVIRSRRAAGDVPPFSLLREAGNQRPRNAPVLNPARVALTVYDLDDDGATNRHRRFAQLLHGLRPGDRRARSARTTSASGGSSTRPASRPRSRSPTRLVGRRRVFDLYMTDRSVD
jgi:hypothetical protein